MTTHAMITRTIAVACEHIATRTLADATPAEQTACRLDAQVQDAVAHLDTVAATGNVLATQGACQVWAQCVRDALKRTRVEGV
jgi:hypothetical protein